MEKRIARATMLPHNDMTGWRMARGSGRVSSAACANPTHARGECTQRWREERRAAQAGGWGVGVGGCGGACKQPVGREIGDRR
jgi:hypothetical protein